MAKKQTVVYTIKRTGVLPKNLKGETFKTYEHARSAIRKYIRARKDYNNVFGTNPAITEYGFSIRKV